MRCAWNAEKTDNIQNSLYVFMSIIVLVLTLVWHFEEIHVTWAYLGKKRMGLQLYTKVDEEIAIQWLETASGLFVTALEHQRNGVSKFEMASERNRLKEALEDLAKRWCQDYKATPSQMFFYIYNLVFRVFKCGTRES
nr:hypothetical protein [Tanacetum cinerariifolium]